MTGTETEKTWRRGDIIVCCLAVAAMAAFFFLHREGTSDIFWQMKAGEFIWKTKSVPSFDIFSYTASGNSWVCYEWLSGVVFFLMERAGGFVALSLLSFALGVGLASTLFAGLVRISRSPAAALILTLAILLIGAPRFQILRPEVFGFIFFAILLLILTDIGRCRPLLMWSAIPILVLWANMHTSVIVGPLVVTLYCAIAFLRGRGGDPARSMGLGRSILLIFSSILAPLINPFTYRVYTFPFEVMTQRYALSVTSDWLPPGWFLPEADISAWGLCALCAACAWLVLRRRGRVDIPLFAVAIACVVPGFMTARFIPFAAIAVAFLAASARKSAGASDFASARASLMVALVLCAALIAPMFKSGPLYGVRLGQGRAIFVFGRMIGAGFDKENFPVEAVDFLERQKAEGRIFNDMAWGGYLIWRRWPGARVFIDTRTAVYGDEFIKEYSDALFGERAFERVADKYGIDRVIYDVRQIEAPGGPLKFLMDDPRWPIVFRSANAVVFARTSDGFPSHTSPRP
ncbi:MAG: hypothetical protein V2A66_06040 [Pseudomonadota bacterium]